MKPSALLVYVDDCEAGLRWYQRAFPEAKRVELPEFDFTLLKIGEFALEVVQADSKVTSGRAGTVLYWQVDNLTATINRLTQLGAKLYRGPIEIENHQSMCQLCDPFGNLIGLRGPSFY